MVNNSLELKQKIDMEILKFNVQKLTHAEIQFLNK